MPPEAMLLVFLPALLYWESLTTSPQEIRRDLRGIVLMSTALVIVTAAAVAVVAHALGLPWGPAWVLGAAVAPTDATAVGVLARVLPRRNVTLLRAESLRAQAFWSRSVRSPRWSWVRASSSCSHEEHLQLQRVDGEDAGDESVLRHDQHYTALRQVQTRLDIEEVRLSRHEVAE